MKTEELNELIQARRSLGPKLFDGSAQIKDEVIWTILENGNWAPNHGKTEPWRFQVFSGEGRQKLANIMTEIYNQFTPPEEFKEDKLEKLKTFPLLCSHVISIGMKRHDESPIPEIEEVAAVACAVQNMHLTAAAHGIAALWSTGGITYYPQARQYFGLEEKDKLMGFFYMGYAKRDWPKGRRKPIREKVIWHNMA